jgi:hypothetical protein
MGLDKFSKVESFEEMAAQEAQSGAEETTEAKTETAPVAEAAKADNSTTEIPE